MLILDKDIFKKYLCQNYTKLESKTIKHFWSKLN